MENTELTPEKSFDLINQVISNARNRIEENGFIYAFWGLLSTATALGQFFLLKNGYFNINYYPYFIMPLGAIYTGFYFYKKKGGEQNQIGKIIGISWSAIVLNVFILSFLLAGTMKENLIPILLVLLGIGTIISGGATKTRLILFSGIILNLAGLLCFNVTWIYQSLLLGITCAIAILVPGIILMAGQKNKQNV
ncbi:MAG: hypothetical protein IH595_04645 [Bacteroidales bacterium]|nr:hypothetical protein [Bacteroidales bacterium]